MLVLLYMLDSHTHRNSDLGVLAQPIRDINSVCSGQWSSSMFNNSCVKLTEIIDCPKNATHYFNCSEIFTTMGTGLYTIDLKCQTVLWIGPKFSVLKCLCQWLFVAPKIFSNLIFVTIIWNLFAPMLPISQPNMTILNRDLNVVPAVLRCFILSVE